MLKINSDIDFSSIQLQKPDGTMSGEYYGYSRIFYGLEPGMYKIFMKTNAGVRYIKGPVHVRADGIIALNWMIII